MFIYLRDISCNNYGTQLFKLIYLLRFNGNFDESCFIYFAFYINNYFVYVRLILAHTKLLLSLWLNQIRTFPFMPTNHCEFVNQDMLLCPLCLGQITQDH